MGLGVAAGSTNGTRDRAKEVEDILGIDDGLEDPWGEVHPEFNMAEL